MKISNEVVSFAKIFIFLNLCLSFYALIFQNNIWLLNIQVAFLSSLIITLTSFFSYRKNIKNRLSNLENSQDNSYYDRDEIDKIEDVYDLYSESDEIKEEDLTAENIKKIIDEERKKLKKNSFKNTIFSTGGFVSIYRVFGYIILIFGFFALNNNGFFMPIAYIIGLGIVPVGILFSKIIRDV